MLADLCEVIHSHLGTIIHMPNETGDSTTVGSHTDCDCLQEQSVGLWTLTVQPEMLSPAHIVDMADEDRDAWTGTELAYILGTHSWSTRSYLAMRALVRSLVAEQFAYRDDLLAGAGWLESAENMQRYRNSMMQRMTTFERYRREGTLHDEQIYMVANFELAPPPDWTGNRWLRLGTLGSIVSQPFHSTIRHGGRMPVVVPLGSAIQTTFIHHPSMLPPSEVFYSPIPNDVYSRLLDADGRGGYTVDLSHIVHDKATCSLCQQATGVLFNMDGLVEDVCAESELELFDELGLET